MTVPQDYYPVSMGLVYDPQKAKMWHAIQKWRERGHPIGSPEVKLDALYEMILDLMEARL